MIFNKVEKSTYRAHHRSIYIKDVLFLFELSWIIVKLNSVTLVIAPPSLHTLPCKTHPIRRGKSAQSLFDNVRIGAFEI